MSSITTEDGIVLQVGDRAFNYYDHKPGTIQSLSPDGWFDFHHEDGTSALLNGERICSLDFARRFHGWIAP